SLGKHDQQTATLSQTLIVSSAKPRTLSAVLRLWRQPERVDVAVHCGCIYAATGNRDRRLVRAAQDQRCKWLASINTRRRVDEDVALRIDEIKRADIDNAIGDRRREQGDPRRRGRP